MNSEGIASSTAKKFRVSTTDSNHSLPVAENILDRDFTAEGPGQKVVSDLTYIATAEGLSVSGLHDRCVLTACDRVVDEP
jgi:putative transposase